MPPATAGISNADRRGQLRQPAVVAATASRAGAVTPIPAEAVDPPDASTAVHAVAKRLASDTAARTERGIASRTVMAAGAMHTAITANATTVNTSFVAAHPSADRQGATAAHQ